MMSGGRKRRAGGSPATSARAFRTRITSSPAEVMESLAIAGFREATDRAQGRPHAPPSPAGPHVAIAMAEDMPLRRSDVRRAVENACPAPMMVTARTP